MPQVPIQIKVEPTKELFVHILTRDIAHHAAITELVDNSVDGARRVSHSNDDLRNFYVSVDFSSDRFSIKDNCGGIPLSVARDYAFRFGRSADAVRLDKSIGQFGVGMKRALFSFGRKYLVQSATKEDWFRLEIDLEQWLQRDGWDFQLTEYGDNDGTKEIGTEIVITELTQDTSRQFDLVAFKTRVESDIKQKHRFFISNGLNIKVCGETIPSDEWQIFADDTFKPEYRENVYQPNGTSVNVRIYAGIGRSNPSDAGWYVVCNGRLVLHADKTDKTGWGWAGVDPNDPEASEYVPRYHNQFARFRGYVLFDSDDASMLPWNTMKTDIDPDSTIWLDTRDQMAVAMRPVIDFLNLVDQESDLASEEKIFTSALTIAKPAPIGTIKNVQKFSYGIAKKRSPKLRTISYRKTEDRIEKLRDAMGANSARDTGDKAFEYAYDQIIDE